MPEQVEPRLFIAEESIRSIDGVVLDAVRHLPETPSDVAPRGAVLLAHGVTADLDEGGMFVRLAEGLARSGFTVLRFSFRGHGASGGAQRGVTLAGEMLDVEAAVDALGPSAGVTLSVVAASFGAVPVLGCLPWLESRLTGLVLWNPVLDLRRTFLKPELPWGLANFSPAALRGLWSVGGLKVDGEFELGRALFTEFAIHNPLAHFQGSEIPALVVHGERDTYVSYDIARSAAMSRPAGCDFHTVMGSDHGFDSRQRENEAIDVTISWLTQLCSR